MYQQEATTAVVPARSYHSCCASKKLPQLWCQQQATTAVVPATSYHRFCDSNTPPQLLYQRHATKTVVPATSYHSCCASNKLPQLLRQQQATTSVVLATSYHSCCASNKLPQLMCQQQATTAVLLAIGCVESREHYQHTVNTFFYTRINGQGPLPSKKILPEHNSFHQTTGYMSKGGVFLSCHLSCQVKYGTVSLRYNKQNYEISYKSNPRPYFGGDLHPHHRHCLCNVNKLIAIAYYRTICK
jgi:hypothetical protein